MPYFASGGSEGQFEYNEGMIWWGRLWSKNVQNFPKIMKKWWCKKTHFQALKPSRNRDMAIFVFLGFSHWMPLEKSMGVWGVKNQSVPISVSRALEGLKMPYLSSGGQVRVGRGHMGMIDFSTFWSKFSKKFQKMKMQKNVFSGPKNLFWRRYGHF